MTNRNFFWTFFVHLPETPLLTLEIVAETTAVTRGRSPTNFLLVNSPFRNFFKPFWLSILESFPLWKKRKRWEKLRKVICVEWRKNFTVDFCTRNVSQGMRIVSWKNSKRKTKLHRWKIMAAIKCASWKKRKDSFAWLRQLEIKKSCHLTHKNYLLILQHADVWFCFLNCVTFHSKLYLFKISFLQCFTGTGLAPSPILEPEKSGPSPRI